MPSSCSKLFFRITCTEMHCVFWSFPHQLKIKHNLLTCHTDIRMNIATFGLHSLCKNQHLPVITIHCSLFFCCTARQTQTTERICTNQHVIVTVVTALIRAPLTKLIFSLRFSFWRNTNTLTHFLTGKMFNVTTSHSSGTALCFLCKCLSWIWDGFSFQNKSPPSLYSLSEMWQYKLKGKTKH